MKKLNTQLFRFKKSYFLILFSLILFNCKLTAQDKITMLDGSEITSKIFEINETQIKYKIYNNQDGPDRVVLKKDIFSIKYENGKIEVYNSVNINSQSQKANTGSDLTDNNLKFDPDKTDFVKKKLKKFDGPRIGFTYLGNGTSYDELKKQNKSNLFSQFGWQFESRIFTTEDGSSALLEFIPMIGGFEQGLFIPSLSVLTGLRNGTSSKFSFEFAMGPNFSLSYNYKGEKNPNLGLVLALGTSINNSNINFPINLVFVPSVGSKGDNGNNYQTGYRLSIIVGYNARKK